MKKDVRHEKAARDQQAKFKWFRHLIEKGDFRKLLLVMDFTQWVSDGVDTQVIFHRIRWRF